MIKNKFEQDYKALLNRVINDGVDTTNRAGIDTTSLFGQQLTIDLSEGMPILTGKMIMFDKAKAEFEWMISGDDSDKHLIDNNVKWWKPWTENNKILKSYPHQLRKYNGNFDQLDYAIKEIKKGSRRAYVTMWNPSDLNEQKLPCCYTGFNFIRENNNLNLVVHFRSSDVFLGLPYDVLVLSYLLLHVADKTSLEASKLYLNLANAHIYEDHIDESIKITNLSSFPLVKLENVNNYKSHNFIKTKLII